jgi:hypothetical protein
MRVHIHERRQHFHARHLPNFLVVRVITNGLQPTLIKGNGTSELRIVDARLRGEVTKK